MMRLTVLNTLLPHLTINNDPDSKADIICNAFIESNELQYLKKNFSSKLSHILIEHIGGISLLDISSSMMPVFFESDKRLEDQKVISRFSICLLEKSAYKSSVEEDEYYNREHKRVDSLSQSCILKFLKSSDEQKKRPNIMKIFKAYTLLLKKGGLFEWVSGVMTSTEMKETLKSFKDIKESNIAFFQDSLGLKNASLEIKKQTESYKVYMKPEDYKDFGRGTDHMEKYSFVAKGYK